MCLNVARQWHVRANGRQNMMAVYMYYICTIHTRVYTCVHTYVHTYNIACIVMCVYWEALQQWCVLPLSSRIQPSRDALAVCKSHVHRFIQFGIVNSVFTYMLWSILLAWYFDVDVYAYLITCMYKAEFTVCEVSWLKRCPYSGGCLIHFSMRLRQQAGSVLSRERGVLISDVLNREIPLFAM